MFCSSQSYEVLNKIFVLGKGTSFKFDIISSLVSTFFFVLGRGTGFFIKLTLHGFKNFVFFDLFLLTSALWSVAFVTIYHFLNIY